MYQVSFYFHFGVNAIKCPRFKTTKISYGGRFMNALYSEKVLLAHIGIKRRIMYRRAKTFGSTHPKVVECSQELDVLINKYLKKVA
jgi:stage 0 sporulation regulatory protein